MSLVIVTGMEKGKRKGKSKFQKNSDKLTANIVYYKYNVNLTRGRGMNEKIVSMLVCTLMIAAVIPVAGTMVINKNIISNIKPSEVFSTSLQDDELDQNQSQYSEDPLGTIRNYSIYDCQTIAQTFKPSLDTLTRIQLFMHKTDNNMMPDLFVSIEDKERHFLGGVTKRSYEIPLGFGWVEFDFVTNLKVAKGEIHSIICRSYCGNTSCYSVAFGENTSYANGNLVTSIDDGLWWEQKIYEDLCFKTYGKVEKEPEADLDCEGTIGWTGIKPGAMVNGEFAVRNVGDDSSMLDWRVAEYPNWGNWLISPEEGINLTTKAGYIPIQVSVVAPDEQNQEFTGEIKVVNVENDSDFCFISVSLATPANKESSNIWSLNFRAGFLERFPLVKHLMGLR